MSKSYTRMSFNQNLITENIRYQNVLNQYEHKFFELEQKIISLEQDIKILKQKNLNLGMEIGSTTVKFFDEKQRIEKEKQRLEKEIQDLSIKNNTLETVYKDLSIKNNKLEAVYVDLQKAYQYEIQQQCELKFKNAKDLNDFLQVVNIYTNELTSVKKQLADEQNKFSELHNILSFCYGGIFKALNASNQTEMINELRLLIPT
jgi:hypothetical protein